MHSVLRSLWDEVSADKAYEHMVYAFNNVPQRLAGSEELRRWAHYLRDELEASGVEAEVHDLDALVSFPGAATLELLQPSKAEFRALPFAHIPSTGIDGVEGELVFVGAGNWSDYEGKDVKGKITLSELSYSPPRQEKERIGSARGAVAHVMMNWGPSDCEIIAYGSVKSVWGNPTPETIGDMPTRPCITVSRATGERLRDLAAQGTVRVRLTAQSTDEWRTSQVTVGKLKGTEAPDQAILIGGHMDAWGGGVSCNAVGNAAVLELARVLAKHRKGLKRSIWFTFWGGHETGTMVGSSWFADHFWDVLADQAITYINVDSPGVVGATEYITRSSSELLNFHKGIEEEVIPELHRRRVRLTRIGDMSFVGMGIPTLSPRTGFSEEQVKKWNGAELGPWHHSDEMTLESVDMKVLQKDLRVYCALVESLSNEAVLPYNFNPVIEEMTKRVTELEKDAPSELHLSGLREEIAAFSEAYGKLHAAVEPLRAKARWPLSKKVDLANRALRGVAADLNAPTSSVNGRWEQDMYGLTELRTVFPSLFSVSELSHLSADDLKKKLLLTSLVRKRNWIRDCVRDARTLVEETVAELA